MDDASGVATGRTSYLSYLLRLWRDSERADGWRASLHDPGTGERLGFGSVEELFTYLHRQIETSSGTDGGQDRGYERRSRRNE